MKVNILNGKLHSQDLRNKRKAEETCNNNKGTNKFNKIPREINLEIPSKSYKHQCHEHMIRNGMWDVFSLPKHCKKENNWYLLLNHSLFPLYYLGRHINIFKKSSEADQYVVQNLIWSGVYLRNNLSNSILHKVLIMIPET